MRKNKMAGFMAGMLAAALCIPDAKKAGGSYVTYSGIVKKVDEYERAIIMTDQTVIPIEQISDIKCEEW